MKKIKNNKVYYGLLIVGISALFGCGGGGSDNDIETDPQVNVNSDGIQVDSPVNEPKDARVTAISMDNTNLLVGDSALVSVGVTYGVSRVEEAGERVIVVVKLPAGTRYAIDSSGIRTENSSVGAAPVKTDCSDGSSFIAYDFGASDLVNAEDPDGREDADFELIFVVDGVSPTGETALLAEAADNSSSYSCDSDFREEVTVGFSVK